jgi:hypothetical protein
MSMVAPEFPVFNNFVETCQVWSSVAHFDEDCQTCPNKANYGILWLAMFTDGQLIVSQCLQFRQTRIISAS